MIYLKNRKKRVKIITIKVILHESKKENEYYPY